MNKIVYFIIVVMLFSCKSNSIAQEKVQKTDLKPKSEQKLVQSGLEDNHRIEPGTIKLIGSIVSLNEDTVVCGTSYKVSVLAKVSRIVNSGQGIVNLLSKGQEVTLVFMNSKNSSTDYDILKNKLVKGSEMSMQVREGLCLDMTQTIYTIDYYKVLD
ncbi:hypothetical protein D1816_15820 [Aquimarina sp. AD10]|uniref:hypothetical protein n=1 Tax=Aquimarina sp. AD10 TaxID=1714849 RepID=UPI000E4F6B95|nr:hypothetical protein [Aquimarina sp. AD10]AXT61759.1 hypothetical protein D1816_15820 [Aquimarina sp. AD10]RKN00890.1 hypothetical protein D7033_05945 [Aquimarina sp. AD10]